eukprot:6463190-Amphidinium_carterae.1
MSHSVEGCGGLGRSLDRFFVPTRVSALNAGLSTKKEPLLFNVVLGVRYKSLDMAHTIDTFWIGK